MNACHESFRRGIDYGRIPGSRWWSKRKWITLREVRFQTKLRPPQDVGNEYMQLTRDGVMTLREGYVFDGITGGLDTRASMRTAAKHDGGCQLIEEGLLPWSFRKPNDHELLTTLVEDRIWIWWAMARYRVVRVWSRAKEYMTKRG